MATVAVATPSKEINPLLAGASPLSCTRPPLKGAVTRSLLTRGSSNAAYLQSLATRPMLTKSLTSGSLSYVYRARAEPPSI